MNQSLRAKNIEFAELAHRDPLTGAMNRHAIRDWLNKHYDDLPIGGKVLSILYLDIDHFKQVNDEYGHAIGDDILKEFTMVLLTSLQAEQRLVRWGGEEFVVFCPGMNLLDTYELGERLRRKVEAHIWVHGDPLTTSIGVATLGEERTNEMLIRADEALYKAKRSGRNRVELSE
jgi:diguanylate cyclase (GGDEF)-like protein